ncbi:TPA: CDP-glycerol glycerophosphotransferase family protein [Morganella morganii]|nr:CDP-glycerol glycerophosphotransferase family protein [Morganella morganii]
MKIFHSPKNKYLILRVSHFLKGFLYSLYYSFINTKREKIIIFNSSCNQDFTWNSKSLFLNGNDKFRSLGYKLYFIVNDDEKRKDLTERYGDYFIDNYDKRNVRLIYSSAIWILSTLETPCSGVFLNRFRFVYHLGHGTPIKNIGLKERKPSILKRIFYYLNDTNISLYLSTSDYFAPYMKNAFGTKNEKIITAPQPRIDDLIKDNTENIHFCFDKNKKYILYSPTWRPYSSVKLFPFDDFNKDTLNTILNKLNIIILIRLHPRYEDDISPYLSDAIINFDTHLCPDISDALFNIDGLITDYSSIYCDYLILKKPVRILPYDLTIYNEKIGFSHAYDELFPKDIINSNESLINFITYVSSLNDSVICPSQYELCKKLNYQPEMMSATDYNIQIIDKEYNKKWPAE